MRTPSRGSSFKDVITKILQKSDLDEYQVELLCRLRDDPNCCLEGVWKRIVDKEPEAGDRAQLVHNILLARYIVEMVRYDVAIDKAQRNLVKANTKVKKWLTKEVLRAPSRQKVEALMQEYGTVFENHEPNFIWDYFSELNIRSDHGALPRTGFMRFMSSMMHQLTGLWCDEEVATLTDIAFPPDEDEDVTSVDMVRSARRGMRS
jgi:hypothetical protein